MGAGTETNLVIAPPKEPFGKTEGQHDPLLASAAVKSTKSICQKEKKSLCAIALLLNVTRPRQPSYQQQG